MAYGANTQLTKALSGISEGAMIIKRGFDFDPNYLRPEYWKADRFNNLTNTWVTFYEDAKATESSTLLEGGLKAATSVIAPFTDRFGVNKGKSVTIFGASITIHKSPTVVETRIKGLTSSVFTQYASNGYDITIDYLETGPVFWQQNSIQIAALVNLLNSGMTLGIASPQLNIIYDVRKVATMDYTIGQDSNFYSHTPISITLKSDDAPNVLLPKTNK